MPGLKDMLKNIEPAEMLSAIKTIFSGKKYYCNDVSIKLLEVEEEKTIQKIRSKKILTRRETEVLQMIAREMTNDEIAQKLYVAKRTVDTHRQNLIKKLEVKNTVGLLRAACKLKLVEE
jgi:two-component system response regulator NreC